MATFTDDQFKAFMAAVMSKKEDIPLQSLSTTMQAVRNDPAALGPIRQCILGNNKMVKLTKFEEWLEEAENRMSYIGTDDDKSKIILLKSWGGPELIEFMKSHVKVKYEHTPATSTAEEQTPDSYARVIEKIKIELSKLVNRTMAMYDLLTTKQGSRSWLDFVHELEKKVKILNFEKQPYGTNDAIKDAAIFGMADSKLREKALAEKTQHLTLLRDGDRLKKLEEKTPTP